MRDETVAVLTPLSSSNGVFTWIYILVNMMMCMKISEERLNVAGKGLKLRLSFS
jgi:hypothetical protein